MLSFRKNSVVKKLMDKRGGRQYQDFPSKTVDVTVLSNFVGKPFIVSLLLGMEKFFASEGYVTIFDFLSKFFCLTVPKNFIGEPFCAVFHKFFGSEKVSPSSFFLLPIKVSVISKMSPNLKFFSSFFGFFTTVFPAV